MHARCTPGGLRLRSAAALPRALRVVRLQLAPPAKAVHTVQPGCATGRRKHAACAVGGDGAAAAGASDADAPAWLKQLVPGADYAAMLRRDPKCVPQASPVGCHIPCAALMQQPRAALCRLVNADPAAAAAKLAALRTLVPGRDVTKARR